MWPAIRELLSQFDEAIIVMDGNGEIAVMNDAARERLASVGSTVDSSGIRVLRLTEQRDLASEEAGTAEFDAVTSKLPVVLAIRSIHKYLYISPTHKQIFGSDPDPFFQDVQAFLHLVHPEDQQRVAHLFDADRAGISQEYECRAKHASGEWRRVHVRVHPFLDSASGELLVASLVEDVTDLKTDRRAAEKELGLSSMAQFRSALAKSVDDWAAMPETQFFAVAIIDLARFRTVNDLFGYSGGDHLLEEVGRRLVAVLPEGDMAAGFGADRFGILLRSALDPEAAEASLREVVRVLGVPAMLGAQSIQMAVRAGLAYPRGMGETPDTLLRNADAALQLAKKLRQPLVVSTITRATRSVEQSSLEFDLSRALDNDEFYFEFQPVFDPWSGRVKLMEALLRWRHPRLGVISPSSFINLAEDSGLVLRLDMQGLERLTRQLDYWRTTAPEVLAVPVSINISGHHFPNFVLEEQFHRLLLSPAMQASRIVFEITESVFVDSNLETAAGLERLRKAGVQIWLDDFGDGYSSFRYLAHFPVDGMKISDSFVKQCTRDEKSRVILSSMQTLARGLGVQVVVEGVENREQFEALRLMGFDALQGYYLSKPLSALDIPALFAAGAREGWPHEQRV